MPDPKLKTPVAAEQRGDVYVIVDAEGNRVPGTGEYTEGNKAREAANRINESWNGAKKERKSKGAPEITREAALQEAVERRQAAAEAGDSTKFYRALAQERRLREEL